MTIVSFGSAVVLSSCQTIPTAANRDDLVGNKKTLSQSSARQSKLPSAGNVMLGSPGKLACASSNCIAGRQVCCRPIGDLFNAPAHCVERGEGCAPNETSIACDDSADCLEGHSCCALGPWGARTHVCIEGVCPDFEVCIPGAICDVGQKCVKAPGAWTGYRCVPERDSLGCLDQSCKTPNDRCCWDPTKRTAHCGAPIREPMPCERAELTFECFSTLDCSPGYSCCFQAKEGATCRGICDTGAILCASDQDCPSVVPNTVPRCNVTNSINLPERVGTCIYQ